MISLVFPMMMTISKMINFIKKEEVHRRIIKIKIIVKDTILIPMMTMTMNSWLMARIIQEKLAGKRKGRDLQIALKEEELLELLLHQEDQIIIIVQVHTVATTTTTAKNAVDNNRLQHLKWEMKLLLWR